MKAKIGIILQEIETVLSKVDNNQAERLIDEILEAQKIVVCGACVRRFNSAWYR
jgi:DNA-binding MurR/RpiR family transcriptional regulator